ncbi:MAG: hypothetical protein AAF085_11400 [Planctomycetota bacterium]
MRDLEPWTRILHEATRAPSPHNTQPWRVRLIDPAHAELFLDAERLMPDEDPTGCFVVSAAGVFIEAVSLLCANHGLRLETHLYDISLDQPMIPIARLTLVDSCDVIGDPSLTKRLATRRTSRLPHRGQTITSKSSNQLASLAEQYGQCFEFTAEQNKIAQMMARNTQAITDDMNNRAYQKEFVGWLRSKRAAKETRDGLAKQNMRVGLLDEFILRHTPWVLRLPLLHVLIAKRYDRLLGQTDHIGWFTGPFWEYDQAVAAGRFLLRYWLMLDQMGMGMHPLGNLATNPEAEAWFTDRFTGGRRPWLIFRFGSTSTPPSSYRLPLKEVLLD